MSKVTLLENEFMALWYHPESGIMHHKFYRYAEGAILKEVLSAGADYLEKHKVSKWLSDDLENPVTHPEDAEWALKVWLPRIIRGGVRYWAIVKPKKIIAQAQMTKFINDDFGSIKVKANLFDNAEDALAWLVSVG